MNETLGSRLTEILGKARDRVIIISAFIGADTLNSLLGACSAEVRKEVYVRWRMDDILSQATDSEIFSVAQSYGANLYCHHKLHAKAYIADNIAVVGSANATNPGLGYSMHSNIELLTETTAGNPDVSGLLAILQNQAVAATPIPQNLLEQLKDASMATLTEEQVTMNWIPMSQYSSAVGLIELGKWDEDAAADCIALGVPYGSNEDQLKSIANASSVFRQVSNHIKETTVQLDYKRLIVLLKHKQYHLPRPEDKSAMPLIDWIQNCAKDMIVIDETTANPKILPLSKL